MELAAYRDLCLDAVDVAAVASFWAQATGRPVEARADGGAVVRGGPLRELRINPEPESKAVKNRVHLDLHVPDVRDLVALGATVLADHGRWQVLADPEGNELCAFPAPAQDVPDAPARPFAICVDSDRPVELAAWWHGVLGGHLGPGPDGRPRWLHDAAGLDGVILKAVQVEDARRAKNRCHWDVTARDVGALVAAGATVLRPPGADLAWTVLADPQGNEFCALAPEG